MTSHQSNSSEKVQVPSYAELKASHDKLVKSLRSIQELSLKAAKGPAHVAKLALSMMADVAAEALENVR